jgi:hypothetical protein
VIYLYAVVAPAAPLPLVDGLEGAPAGERRIDEFAVVVSEHESLEPEPTEEAVLAHATVVDEVFRRGAAVLPARFGCVFADEPELASAVRSRGPELRRGLEAVRDAVELGLCVVGRTSPPPPLGVDGRSYMRRRLGELAEDDRIAAATEPLARLARATRRGHSVDGAVRIAYLVGADRVERFREELARIESAAPHLSLVCTGPWPPYSFSALGQEEASLAPA